MNERLIRTSALIGEEAIDELNKKKVAVFGIGGVGSYVVEALARSGVGAIDLIDKDKVAESNINRQLIATVDTIGLSKVEVAKKRILSINPECVVSTYECFFLPENSDEFDFTKYDYVVDCVDTVTAKIELVMCAKKANVPIISSMGTGNKLDPTRFEVSDIFKTSVCPLAKVMRKELKARGIKNLKVVYSKEEPLIPKISLQDGDRRSTPSSIAFVPSVAGLIIAGEVIKDMCVIKHS